MTSPTPVVRFAVSGLNRLTPLDQPPTYQVVENFWLSREKYHQWMQDLAERLPSCPAEVVPLALTPGDSRVHGFWLLAKNAQAPMQVYDFWTCREIHKCMAQYAKELSGYHKPEFFVTYLKLWSLFHLACSYNGSITISTHE